MTGLTDEKEISVFRKAIAGSVRGTGRVVTDPKKALRDISDAIAVGVEDNWSAGLIKLIDKLTKEEKLDPKWIDTAKGRYFFQQVQQDLHNLRTDESMLEAKISLFLGVISEDFKDKSEIEAREAWNTINNLGVTDIVLLGTLYRVSKHEQAKVSTLNGPGAWRNFMAKASGLNYIQPVEQAEERLIALRLVHDKKLMFHNLGDKSRITGWGTCVAEYLAKGKTLLEGVRDSAGLGQ